MKITPHFSLAEFACRDGTAYPRMWIDSRLRPLCQLLERLRVTVGDRPLEILSGFRTPPYNRRIGGARASQHVDGRAADIHVPDYITAAQLHARILQLVANGDLDGREGRPRLGGLGLYPSFVHVDIRPTPRLVRWGGSRKEN